MYKRLERLTIKIIVNYFKLKRWIILKQSEPITQFQLAFGTEAQKQK